MIKKMYVATWYNLIEGKPKITTSCFENQEYGRKFVQEEAERVFKMKQEQYQDTELELMRFYNGARCVVNNQNKIICDGEYVTDDKRSILFEYNIEENWVSEEVIK